MDGSNIFGNTGSNTHRFTGSLSISGSSINATVASTTLGTISGNQFVAAGTIIKNLNPGGKQVKGSFEKFYNYWFATKVNSVINSSGILDKIDQETARVLNSRGSGPVQVRNVIINLLKQYSKGEIII